MSNSLIQNKQATVGVKSCPISGQEFIITQDDLDFYNKISPSFGGKKFQIPAPTLAPLERQRRRLAFRNERKLYRRTCDASGKPIISMYAPKEVTKGNPVKDLLGDAPDSGLKVYETKIRYGDSRNALDYGQEFDFSTTFTENFARLSVQVPRPSMYNYFAENSDYCNCTNYQKNCYLTSASSRDEQCMYGAYTNDCAYCLDTLMTFNSEQCYMTIDCEQCYHIIYGSNCRNCSESYFISNCNNCNFCRNCDGLENQSYCIDNQQYSKEEYLTKIEILRAEQSQQTYTARSQRSQSDTILFSDGCTGHHIKNSKNSIDCADSRNLENCKYCTWFYDSKDCHDIYSRGQNAEMSYNSVAIGENVYGILFCTNIDTNSQRIFYSMHCMSCSDCFGCVGLRNKQYCIFNKQYTKEEYELTVSKIISHMMTTGEWGEFFHPSLSPFGYNETVAQEYYPATSPSFPLHYARSSLGYIPNRAEGCPQEIPFEDSPSPSGRGVGVRFDDLVQFGYKRSDYESPKPVSNKIIQAIDLPHTIEEVQDDILHYAISCEITGKLFRIQPQELVFYRKHQISLPRKHPDQRHTERLALRK